MSSDQALASTYLEHREIGDPAADALMTQAEGFDPEDWHSHVSACMSGHDDEARRAPRVVRDFFEHIHNLPDWYFERSTLPGCRLFHRYSDLFLTAFVVSVIIRGFTTRIAHSFFATGRLTDHGVRRLRQNIRHVLEIMMPAGLDPYGDGWKLSVRIRLVHARMRKLLSESREWDNAGLGLPLNAAHMGYAASAFSAMMLHDGAKLGIRANAEERASFMHIWRCSAWQMGVPEAMLFRDESHALEIVRTALIHEPPVDLEGIAIANAVINSAPIVSGIKDAEARKSLTEMGYRLARAILGNEMADTLRFPKYSTIGALALFRGTRWLRRWRSSGDGRYQRFLRLLEISTLEEQFGHSYRLPDHPLSERSTKW